MSKPKLNCVCCFKPLTGNLKLNDIELTVLPWFSETKGMVSINDIFDKLLSIQKDVLRLLQWHVITHVYKSVHSELGESGDGLRVTDIVNLSPSVINQQLPGLTATVLPSNFVQHAIGAVSEGLEYVDGCTISHLLANLTMHPLVDLLRFGPCCEQLTRKLRSFFPDANNNPEVFASLLEYTGKNICHQMDYALNITNELEDYIQESEIAVMTVYKQDKKECVTGYCSLSKREVFDQFKNYNERIQPQTNPTMFTISYEEEKVVLLVTLDTVINILHTIGLHTPVGFVISNNDHENSSFANKIIYDGIKETALIVAMKKKAPAWCKNYVDYITASISLLKELVNDNILGDESE